MKKNLLTVALGYCFLACHISAENLNISAKQEEQKIDYSEKPQIVLSGSASVHNSFTKPKVRTYQGDSNGLFKTNKKPDMDSTMARLVSGEADIEFKAIGRLQNGVEYGAYFDLYAMKGDTGMDKVYLQFTRTGWGTLQIGNLKGPEAKMLCSGQQLLGGTCGIDGTVEHDIDQVEGCIRPLYVIGNSSKATKIVYYTPRVYGLQFGVALTPDTKHIGHNDKTWRAGDSSAGNDLGLFRKGSDDKQRPSGRTNVALGLSHAHDFKNGFATKFAAVYVFEDTRPILLNNYTYTGGQDTGANSEEKKVTLRNARSYHLTASVKYNCITLAAGYLNNGHSRLPVKKTYDDFTPCQFMSDKNANAGKSWNVGAKYEVNEWTLAFCYHHATRKITSTEKAQNHIYTLTVDYKICDGLMLFAEFDYENAKSTPTACMQRNKITTKSSEREAIKRQKCGLIALGAKVSF